MLKLNRYFLNSHQQMFFPTEWLNTTKNSIVVGAPQSGKTHYVMNIIPEILRRGEIPILIASDKKNVLDQYRTRFSSDMNAIVRELSSDTFVPFENLNSQIIYISILSSMRLKKIQELIYHGIYNYRKRFVLIIDEADMSIKDLLSPLEIIQRQMDNLGPYLKRIYITATPFAVLNSKAISQHIEEFTMLPLDYYQDLEYRDYFNMEKISTVLIDKIEEELTEENIANFATYLGNEMSQRLSHVQPNIGLLKLFHDNFKKHDLAQKLSTHLQHFGILVYTGKGCVFYYNSQVISVWKNGSCISRILQKIKNDGTSCPFLIISYNMAGRAETFKSEDREWNLTHFLISIPKKSSVEQTVQSMRCNGQYKPSDSIIKVYASERTHDRINKMITNNNAYVERLGEIFKHYKQIDTRTCLNQITLLKIPYFKFSTRKGVDDIKVIKSNDDGCCKTLEHAITLANYLTSKNNCIGYKYVTKQHINISREEILLNIKDPDISYAFNNFEFKGLLNQAKTLLRQYIKDKCQIYKCQIAYCEQRSRELNKLHKAKGQGIAEILANGNISVVVYKDDCYNYENKVIIWLDTKGIYHLHVNKPNADYKLMSLSNK
jgi:KaiC/GvpD/RAD55 family RecA-like ATPase